MTSFNFDSLIKAIVAVIALSVSVGQFSALKDFALREGIKAVTLHGYRPTHFFPKAVK
jgi:hypothetical protein